MHNDDDTGAGTGPADEQVWTTLVRFSRTPLDPDDATRLQRWVAEDPTRRDMVLAVQRLAGVARQRPPRARADAAWARVSARLAGDSAPPPAAAAARPNRVSGALRASALVSERRRRQAARVALLAMAAGVVALVAERDAVRRLITERAAERAPMRELATGVGERVDVRLDDGSTVTLAPMSRLRYGKLAGASTRTVELEGEGYFTIAPDAAHPFTVFAGTAAVQAVGTAFDVRAYAGDSVVRVVTTHGRVALRPRTARAQLGTLVDRGQQGTLDASGFAIVSAADTAGATGWLADRVTYELEPLPSLLRDLQRRYDLEFVVADSALADVRVTITFERASADVVIEQLAATLGVAARRDGRIVRLGGS